MFGTSIVNVCCVASNISILHMPSVMSLASGPFHLSLTQKSVTPEYWYNRELVFRKKIKVSYCARTVRKIKLAVNHEQNTDFRNTQKKQLAVFVSGGGSNFQAIHEATLKGNINGTIAVLVTDKPDCGGAKYAQDNGIPVILFPKTKFLPETLSSCDLLISFRNFEVDFILLAGYLKLIPSELVRAYPRSILNIHPSLLPAFGGKGFYGLKVHKAVIESGARYSGATVHFVDEHYDKGSILAQRVVPVLADDSPQQLAVRVLHEEHQVYVQAVAALCEDRVVWRGDGVPIIRIRDNPDEFI